MPVGDPGQGEFRNAVINGHRNRDLVAVAAPVMDLREEVGTSADLQDRGGFDTTTRDHFLAHLLHADRVRRHVTAFREDADDHAKSEGGSNETLETLIAEVLDPDKTVADVTIKRPFGGESVQMPSTGLFDWPWDLSGVDPDVPLVEELVFSSNGLMLLGEINATVVTITSLNSRLLSERVTPTDSRRVASHYLRIYGFLMRFGGDVNRRDFAQLRRSSWPRGPENSPNMKTADAGKSTPASGARDASKTS